MKDINQIRDVIIADYQGGKTTRDIAMEQEVPITKVVSVLREAGAYIPNRDNGSSGRGFYQEKELKPRITYRLVECIKAAVQVGDVVTFRDVYFDLQSTTGANTKGRMLRGKIVAKYNYIVQVVAKEKPVPVSIRYIDLVPTGAGKHSWKVRAYGYGEKKKMGEGK